MSRRPLILLVFFISGVAALAYETLWFRQASLTMGNSVWAGSMVLSSFMAGLALGNLLAGRFGHRSRNPIRIYAYLELLIAGSGLSLVLLFPHLNTLLTPLFQPYLDQPMVLNSMRLGIGFLLMLSPTVAMGATLPLMVRGLKSDGGAFGERLGLLYACNTIGAMCGALLCDMVLIEAFGIRESGFVAAACNLIAGVAAFGLSRGVSSAELPVAESSRKPLSSSTRRILLAAFLCGGTLLALEVVWFRFMLLFNFGTSRVFTFMLTIVLGGIALGGMIGARWLKSERRRSKQVLPMVALTSGIAAVLSFVGPALYVTAFPFTARLDLSGWSTFRDSIPVMLPVSVLSGFLFTLMGDAIHLEEGADAKSAGYLTLFNTVGAMCGALLAGFVLLPLLGIQKSMMLLALVYGGVALLCRDHETAPALDSRAGKAFRLGGLALIALVAVFFSDGLSRGVFLKVADRYCGPRTKVSAVKEGLTSTLMYTTTRFMDEPLYHRLITNSHSMSGTGPGEWAYMKMYVYLPVALHPAPRKACLISYGCGITGKALTDTKELEQIDIVDISPQILELNSVVYPTVADRPLNDPRVRVHIEDGRFFLQTTDQYYDLITAEPPPPKGAGVVNLYTREYFQLLHDRLAPGGITTYWLPHHDLNEQDSRVIMRAFCDVFENCSLWLGSGDNWMLVGIRDGYEPVSEERYRRQWNDPDVAPILAASGFESPEQFASFFIADSKTMREMTRETLPLVDNYPNRLSPTSNGLSPESKYKELLEPEASKARLLASEHVRQLIPRSMIDASLPYFRDRGTIHDFWCAPRFQLNERPHKSLPALHHLLTESKLRTPILWSVSTSWREQRAVDRLKKEHADELAIVLLLAHRSMADRDFAAAADGYFRCLKQMPKDSAVYQRTALYAAFNQCLSGSPGEAQASLDKWLGKNAALKPELRMDAEYLVSAFELKLSKNLLPRQIAASAGSGD